MGKDIELVVLFADVVGSTRLFEVMGDLFMDQSRTLTTQERSLMVDILEKLITEVSHDIRIRLSPTADWGVMVSTGETGVLQGYPLESLSAGLCIVLVVVAINLLGESLAARGERRIG